jgi:hypothetical protein
MNRLLTSLGYESARRGRAAVTAPSWEAPQVSADDDELDEFSETLHEQLVDKLEAMTWLPPEWSALTQGRPIKLTVVPRPDMGPPRHWLIDLTPVNLTLCRFEPVGGEAVAVTTDPATLADVVAGELNLATAISRRQVHLTAGAAARESGDGPGREDARVRLQLLAYLFVDAMSPPAPPGAASPPVADSDDAEPEADAGSEGPDDLAAEASPATEPASEPEPPTGDAGDLEHPVATAAEVRS